MPHGIASAPSARRRAGTPQESPRQQFESLLNEAKTALVGCTSCMPMHAVASLLSWCKASSLTSSTPDNSSMRKRGPQREFVDGPVSQPIPLSADEMMTKMRAMGRVLSPSGTAAGFLFRLPERPDKLLVATTCRALPTFAAASQAICSFQSAAGGPVEVPLDPRSFFWSSEFVEIPIVGSPHEVHRLRVDCAICACTDSRAVALPALNVSPSPIEVLHGDSIVHLHQGHGGEKAMAVGVVTDTAGITIRDTLRKLDATPGSPILDSRWEAVAFTPEAHDGAGAGGLFIRGLLHFSGALRSAFLDMHHAPPPPGETFHMHAAEAPAMGRHHEGLTAHSSGLSAPGGASGTGASTPSLSASHESLPRPRPPSPVRPASPPVPHGQQRPRPVTVYVASLERATMYHSRAACGPSRFPMELLEAVREGRQPCEECGAPAPFFSGHRGSPPSTSKPPSFGPQPPSSASFGAGEPAARPHGQHAAPRPLPHSASSPPRRRPPTPPRATPPEQRRTFSPERERPLAHPDRPLAHPDRPLAHPDRPLAQPDHSTLSPEGRTFSPERRTLSPERRTLSPERRTFSPERHSPPERYGGPEGEPLRDSREQLLSPKRTRGSGEPPDDMTVYTSDLRNTARRYHVRFGCHGARDAMSYAQARAERRSRCPQCFPKEGGTVVSELRSLSNLFKSRDRALSPGRDRALSPGRDRALSPGRDRALSPGRGVASPPRGRSNGRPGQDPSYDL